MTLTSDVKERLDKFLARALPQFSRSRLAELAASGAVLVEGKAEKPSFMLSPGMQVEMDLPTDREPHDLTPAEIPIEVLFEDERMMVVNKPRGLAVHPAPSLKEPSLVNALLARGGPLSGAGEAFRPGIVHRLDKDTTGVMLVAKTDATHASLASQIEKKTAVRKYLAVVAGRFEQPEFTISAPIARSKRNRLLMAVDPAGKPAVTHIKVVGSVDAGTIVEATLETGRTHQIRVHLLSIGHPVLGDRLYAPKAYREGPLQLHAASIRFRHPASGEEVEVTAEPPLDFLIRRT